MNYLKLDYMLQLLSNNNIEQQIFLLLGIIYDLANLIIHKN